MIEFSLMKYVFIVIGLTGSLAGYLAGQTGNGSIQGTVRDKTAAVIAGAKTRLEQTATNRLYTGQANGQGFYLFPSLPPGQYQLTVESAGMQTFKGAIQLQAGQAASVDVELDVAATASEVVVTAEVSALLTTTQATIANVVERERIEQLPLNGRLFTSLIAQTTPGVEGDRVNGLRTTSMEFVQDGATLNQRNVGGAPARPPGLDTIQEFRVETSVSSAKYNRPASTIVSTRSGTNQLRGSLFHTMRNNGVGVARRRQDFFSKPPQLIRNEFGASAGGPVWIPKVYNGRNRTFVFGAWEEFKLRSGANFGSTIPTDGMWNGDFSGLVDGIGRQIVLYDPQSTAAVAPFTRSAFPGNRIPLTRRSPVASFLSGITQRPTLGDVNPLIASNWFGPSPNSQDHRTLTFRVDHRLRDRDQVFARYTKDERLLEQRRSFNNNSPIPIGNLANFEFLPVYSQNGVFSWTRVWSPTLFMETIFTGMVVDTDYNTTAPGLDTDWAGQLKLPNPFRANGLPDFIGTGFNLTYEGPRPRKDVTNILSIEQNFNKIAGKHQIEFGWRMRRENLDVLPDQEQNQGRLDFGSLATALYDPASSGNNILTVPRTGNNFANLFLGVAGTYTATFNRGWYYIRGQENSAYVQDNWKVTPNLTVNLGMRYEFFSPVREKNDVLLGFDVKSKALVTPVATDRLIELGYTNRAILNEYARVGVRFISPADAGIPKTLIEPNWFDVSPRVGFAWKKNLAGKMWVLRGGVGTYRFPPPLRTFNSRMRSNPPMQATTNRNLNNAAQNPDGLGSLGLRSAPSVIAGVNSQNVLTAEAIVPFVPGQPNAVSFDVNQPTSYANEWNFTLETEIAKSTVLRASYVGTQSRNLDQWQRINDQANNYIWFASTGQALPTGNFANTARRPFDNRVFGQIEVYRRTGYQNFNSVQLEVQRRYAKGVAYQFFYVLSNSMGTGNIATGDSSTNAVFNPEVYMPGAVPLEYDARNRFLNYRRDTDIPQHRFRWNFLVDVPVGKGKKLWSNANGFWNRVAGGWQLAGSGTWSSRYWSLPTGNWGALRDIEVYGYRYPIEDCRSGDCIPGYLFYNGYIPANRINSVDAQGRPNGVMGVPQNYRPAHLPVWPTPANPAPGDPNTGLFESNDVFVRLNNGINQRVALNTNLHPWRNQAMAGPWIFGMNASLFKAVAISERVALRFNADFFNVFNNPGNNLPDSSSGIISRRSSAQDARQLQFTLRLSF
jgi:hypothetical protein